MEDCEALLMIGTSFPYIEFLPKPKGVRGIQIELNPKKWGFAFLWKWDWWATAGGFCGSCCPGVDEKQNQDFLRQAQASMKDWREKMEKEASRRDKPMKPQVVAHELGRRLRSDAIVSCDSGTITTWWARHIP